MIETTTNDYALLIEKRDNRADLVRLLDRCQDTVLPGKLLIISIILSGFVNLSNQTSPFPGTRYKTYWQIGY